MTHPHEIGPPNHNCSMLAGPLVRTVDHWYVQWYVSACAQCKKTRSAEFAHFKMTVLGFYPKKHEVLKLPKSRCTRAPVPSMAPLHHTMNQHLICPQHPPNFHLPPPSLEPHPVHTLSIPSTSCLCSPHALAGA